MRKLTANDPKYCCEYRLNEHVECGMPAKWELFDGDIRPDMQTEFCCDDHNPEYKNQLLKEEIASFKSTLEKNIEAVKILLEMGDYYAATENWRLDGDSFLDNTVIDDDCEKIPPIRWNRRHGGMRARAATAKAREMLKEEN